MISESPGSSGGWSGCWRVGHPRAQNHATGCRSRRTGYPPNEVEDRGRRCGGENRPARSRPVYSAAGRFERRSTAFSNGASTAR